MDIIETTKYDPLINEVKDLIHKKQYQALKILNSEEIHKIRERNYEITKTMTTDEKLRYYNTPRTDAEKQIERLREARKGVAIAK